MSRQLSLLDGVDHKDTSRQRKTKKWRTKQAFHIITNKKWEERKGYVSDTECFAIHKREDLGHNGGWALTHYPTGKLIAGCSTLKEAKLLAEWCEDWIDVDWWCINNLPWKYQKQIKDRRRVLAMGRQADMRTKRERRDADES